MSFNSYTATDVEKALEARQNASDEAKRVAEGGFTLAAFMIEDALSKLDRVVIRLERELEEEKAKNARLQPECDRDKIIEECAAVVESIGRQSAKLDGQSFYIALGQAAKEIRALKNAAPQATAQDATSREEADAGRNRQHGTPVGTAPGIDATNCFEDQNK